ncbi:hypothetical protein [Nonomuraea typhae]|uniref:hypothetical protein n=1 Tax=Nonomuraea typhae TaxID=2603600 RepID=UPI0012FC967C|nr:hypothetical protein [Nonomuraea typhae]
MGDLRSAALAYVRAGQVRAHTVATPPGAPAPVLVVATVHGHNGRYQIVYDATRPPEDRWSCPCRHSDLCPHIAAVGLWAGHPGLAARTIPERTRL